MLESAYETVGEKFSTDLLLRARDKTLRVIELAAEQIRPGITEIQARELVQEIQSREGASKSWHPPQIRFGQNTVLPFGQKGKEAVVLAQNDIFFFDIGPIFSDHEGDVGRAFTVGADEEMKRCCADVETIWSEVRQHWLTSQASGEALYAFAQDRARARNWILSLQKANGHRIADFPHAARERRSIEGFAQRPAPNRWILEIQIRHPNRPFGAFYEDLLS